jgi:hypothetical protein
MKSKLPDVVEKGRMKYHGQPGDLHGAFMIPCGVERLRVISGPGSLWELGGITGPPWDHVSVSLSFRTPLWEEMCYIKDLFFEPDEWVVQFHPAKSDYINDHPYVLHLWRLCEGEFPKPPKQCV